MKKFALGFLLVIAQLGQAQTRCAASLPADICTFENKIYTQTDFKNTQQVQQVLLELKSLLMKHSNDSVIIQDHLLTLGDQIVEESYNQRAPKNILSLADGQRNLLEMLKKLRKWEEKNGQIVPLDWRLPDGFTIGITAFDRTYDVSTDRLRFSLSFFSVLDRPLEIEQFQISRYGGAVVIDKQADIGYWNQGIMSSTPNRPYVSAGSDEQDTPLADGLYLLKVKVKGEKLVSGWFFLHGSPTTSPVVESPQVNEKITSSNPSFRFQNYASSSRLPSDSRKLSVSIFHEGDHKQVWSTQYINPENKTSVTLGQDKNQSDATALAAGAYRLNLAFEERSYFGDLTIGRLVHTQSPIFDCEVKNRLRFTGGDASLWVDPDYSRQGLAKTLKERGEEWAREHRLDHISTFVHCKNSSMQVLNERLGYELVGYKLRKNLR